MSLNKAGDVAQALGQLEEARSLYGESLAICRQLRHALGDNPQVLDDLAVSLERLAQMDGGAPVTERKAAMQEALNLRERLVEATQQSPWYVTRLERAQQMARDLFVHG